MLSHFLVAEQFFFIGPKVDEGFGIAVVVGVMVFFVDELFDRLFPVAYDVCGDPFGDADHFLLNHEEAKLFSWAILLDDDGVSIPKSFIDGMRRWLARENACSLFLLI